ncbi:MAG: ParA family protein [Thermoplasmata archaeon]
MIVTVFALKGGVGKTFVAVNLAWKLSEQGRVALLELDYQESIPAFLGIHPGAFLSDALMEPLRLAGAVVQSGPISVISGGPGLFKLEFESSSRVMSNFNSMLGALDKRFNYVVVDTHNTPGVLTESVLSRSSAVIVPARPGVLNEVGLNLTLNLLSKIRTANPFKEIGILNGIRRNVLMHRAFMDMVKKFGIFIDDYLPYSAMVEKSELKKEPIYRLDLRFLSPFESIVNLINKKEVLA